MYDAIDDFNSKPVITSNQPGGKVGTLGECGEHDAPSESPRKRGDQID
jgi:hypothetical protein